MRDKPAGTIRIVASDFAINYVLWPKLKKFLPKYPDIKVELIRDNGLTDIVTQRFDAGVRMGEQLAKDMISVRIGPDFRFAVVGAPAYFKKNPEPSRPQDLVRHSCINDRHATGGGLWAWEFEEKGREIKIRVDGQLVFNNSFDVIEAALDGFGLAYVPEEIALPYLRRAGSRACSKSVAHSGTAITCIIRAAASHRQPSLASSTLCAIAVERTGIGFRALVAGRLRSKNWIPKSICVRASLRSMRCPLWVRNGPGKMSASYQTRTLAIGSQDPDFASRAITRFIKSSNTRTISGS